MLKWSQKSKNNKTTKERQLLGKKQHVSLSTLWSIMGDFFLVSLFILDSLFWMTVYCNGQSSNAMFPLIDQGDCCQDENPQCLVILVALARNLAKSPGQHEKLTLDGILVCSSDYMERKMFFEVLLWCDSMAMYLCMIWEYFQVNQSSIIVDTIPVRPSGI